MVAPGLEQVLADVERLPEGRQQDAADCIRRTLAMDEQTISRWNRQNDEASTEAPLDLPERSLDQAPAQSVRIIPRDPFVANAYVIDELGETIALIRQASEPWQRVAVSILSLLVENDRWDVILPPGERIISA